jgi:hypothetical protein
MEAELHLALYFQILEIRISEFQKQIWNKILEVAIDVYYKV